VIYESSLIQTSEMHYRIKEKLAEIAVCNLLVVCSNNLVLCQVRRFKHIFRKIKINFLLIKFVRKQDFNVYH